MNKLNFYEHIYGNNVSDDRTHNDIDDKASKDNFENISNVEEINIQDVDHYKKDKNKTSKVEVGYDD